MTEIGELRAEVPPYRYPNPVTGRLWSRENPP